MPLRTQAFKLLFHLGKIGLVVEIDEYEAHKEPWLESFQ